MDGKAEVRFGDRLRREIPAFCVFPAAQARLTQIADAIDQDAFAGKIAMERTQGLLDLHSQNLRGSIERLVEELRYAVASSINPAAPGRDVLDVEPFLAHLAGIFGAEEVK